MVDTGYYLMTFHLLENVGNSRRQSWKKLKQLHKRTRNAEETMSKGEETKERHIKQKRGNKRRKEDTQSLTQASIITGTKQIKMVIVDCSTSRP